MRNHVEIEAIYSSVGVGLGLLDTDGRFLNLNRDLAVICGRSAGELVGRSLLDTLPVDLADQVRPLLSRAACGVETVDAEINEFDESGTPRRVLCVSLLPIQPASAAEAIDAALDPDNGTVLGGEAPSGITVMIKNITQQRWMESKLLSSQRRLAISVDTAKLGCWTWYPKTNEVDLDATECAILGLPFTDARRPASDFFDLVEDSDREEVEAALRRSFTPDAIYDSEFRIKRHQDGETRWIAGRGDAFRGPSGDIEMMVGTNWDITERRRGEDRIRQSERRLRLAVEAAALGVWDVFVDRGVVVFDERSADLFNMQAAKEHPIGSAFESIHPGDRKQVKAALAAASDPRGDGNYEATYRLIRHDLRHVEPIAEACEVVAPAVDEVDAPDDDRYLWVHATGRCVFRASRNAPNDPAQRVPYRMYGILMDITEQHADDVRIRRAQRRAEAANRAKSEFLANMSHEIRTPMSAILGYADILMREIEQPDSRAMVQTIRDNGQFLLEIINDILDLAKIESGKISIDYEQVSPARVVEEVVALMQVRSLAKGLTLTIEYPNPLPEHFPTDPKRLRQVLFNLVGNAIKFTNHGGVCICLCVDDDRLRFEIRDTGIGIAPDEQKRIFEPFSQADGSHQRRHGGTGLGLSISQRLSQLLGGTLEVRSEADPDAADRGSTFMLTLPLGAAADAPRKKVRPVLTPPLRTPVEPDAGVRLAGRRILVVDDRRDLRTLLQMVLEEVGATVTLACDGAEAVKVIEGNTGGRIDGVVMDMQMPVLDGYAATRALREAGFDQPVVAVTAHATEDDEARCLDAGCTAFITKPINGDELIAMLDRALRVQDEAVLPVIRSCGVTAHARS